MVVKAKNNRQILLRRLNSADLDSLFKYLQNLSPETKSRFGPHPFDRAAIQEFYGDPVHRGYLAVDPETSEIVAYSIIRQGFLEHDSDRLISYGLVPDHRTDCTFAPSVADAWQSCGIGNLLFHFILDEFGKTDINRIILWGGVQAGNEKAVKFYEKNGFRTLGQFSHNGNNYDMTLDLDKTNR
jgi:GNAT superfamily N-acetyltransferase